MVKDFDNIRSDVTTLHGTDPVVRFYNQPRVSIKVTKTEFIDNAASSALGWGLTLTGCGQNLTGTTAADGTYTFANLPVCANYTVSENPVSKLNYSADGGITSKTVAAITAGTQYPVSFTNRKFTFTPCTTCTPLTFETPTPTPTSIPPTATPTTKPGEQPTATRTPIDVILGEKTPGPVQPTATPTNVNKVEGEKTPIAPSTGSGLIGGGGGSTNIALALMGLTALSGGLATLALGRRKSRS